MDYIICVIHRHHFGQQKSYRQTHCLAGRQPQHTGRRIHAQKYLPRDSPRQNKQRSFGLHLLGQVRVQQVSLLLRGKRLAFMKILLCFNQLFIEDATFPVETVTIFYITFRGCPR